MTGYYYTDGARIYYTGESARVVMLADGTILHPHVDSILDAEIVLEDILDAEVIG